MDKWWRIVGREVEVEEGTRNEMYEVREARRTKEARETRRERERGKEENRDVVTRY